MRPSTHLCFLIIMTAACGTAQDAEPADPDASTRDADSGASGSGIVGDWMRCLTPDCSELDRLGSRFTADGKLHRLFYRQLVSRDQVLPPVQEGDPYCVAEQDVTYVYAAENGELILTNDEGRDAITTFEIDDDIATLGGQVHLRVEENATGTWDSYMQQCELE